MVAQHAASLAREKQQAAEPSPWLHLRQTADRVTDAQSRPITAVLMDEF
jgi:hypothetical protein